MRFKRHFAALFVIGSAIAIPLAGCGGGGDDSSTSADTSGGEATQASTTAGGGGGASQTVDMTAVDYKFNPSDTTVNSGNVTFNLKNDGQQPHSLEIEDVNGQDQELEGDVSPGQSGTLKVNLPSGKYEFYCPVPGHKEMGMEGEITVK
ncbi:MAG TPA: cupredoxin domain-containing protein [Solirubrobacterales bacterium]|nr:cupredoxin domain-containing protein [Solirubrobacterales bacterium]